MAIGVPRTHPALIRKMLAALFLSHRQIRKFNRLEALLLPSYFMYLSVQPYAESWMELERMKICQ